MRYFCSFLQRNPCYLRPWLVLNGIGLALDLLNVIKAAFSLALLNLVINLVGWLLVAYLFLVVLSYSRQMEADNVAGDEEGNCSPHERSR